MNSTQDDGFIRQREILKRVPFSAATLWRMVTRGDFPKPVKLTPGVTAWRNSEFEDWITTRTTRTK